MEHKKVYAAIAAITGALAETGIEKNRKNQQQGYNFRGIDEIYNNLAPLLKKHQLCILPQVESREIVERMSQKGQPLFYVTVRVRFQFVSPEDGSSHDVVTYGEAMDLGDKATNKAMSAAYKYACLQTFCIPTEGDNDADATTHEVAPERPATPPMERFNKAMAVIMATETEAELGRLVNSGNYKALLADLDETPMKAVLMNAVTEQYGVLYEKAAAYEKTVKEATGRKGE